MVGNQPGKYVGQQKSRSDGVLVLFPKKLWSAMAMDFGAYNETHQTSGNYDVVGFNDLLYLTDDLWALAKTKKVKVLEKAGSPERDRPLRLEERLRKQLPTYFRNRDPAYRSCEILEAAADVVGQLGYRVAADDGRPDLWAGSDDDSLGRVNKFHLALREQLLSSAFRDVLHRREQQAARDLECQESLVLSMCGRFERFGVIALDLGCQHVQVPYGYSAVQGYASPSLLACADQLLNAVQFDPTFEGRVLGAVIHLEYHQEQRQYLRAIFLVIPGDMGYRQLFQVRLFRAWQLIVGQRGWMDDCRLHPNKIVASVGPVSTREDASVYRLRRALVYGAQKDVHMRVYSQATDSFIVRELRPAIFDA